MISIINRDHRDEIRQSTLLLQNGNCDIYGTSNDFYKGSF